MSEIPVEKNVAPAEQLIQGCQKLSLKMLEKMGALGCSKYEMNFLISLASVQSASGIAYSNLHMMRKEIGCSNASFMTIMHKLSNKGLITFTRSVDYHIEKSGIYRIDLVYNHFDDDDFIKNPYIRIGHGIFRTEKFYALPVVAKFLFLMTFYDLRELKKSEFKSWNAPFYIEYLKMKESAIKWNGCSERTFRHAVYTIKKAYTGKYRLMESIDLKHPNMTVEIHLDPSEIAFQSSDMFAYLSNILSAMGEEEGLHMCEEFLDPSQMAELIVRNRKQAEKIVSEAKKKYDTALQIMNTTGAVGNKKQAEQVHEMFADYRKIEQSLTEYPEEFGTLKQNHIHAWGKRKFIGTMIQNKDLATWLRFLMGKAVAAYKFVMKTMKNRSWNFKEFNLLPAVEKFMHIFINDKNVNANYISREIWKCKIS